MKKRLYLVLSILTLIILLTTAALCNLGGTQSNEETHANVTEGSDQAKGEKKDSSVVPKSSDSVSEATTSSTASANSDNKDTAKSADNKSASENKPPVISGIYLDGLDPIDYFFFTGDTYTIRAEAIDPEGGSLTFSWSGDGTISGNDMNPMTWTAPASDGVYNITVEATDDKGATSAFTADIYVNPKAAVGDPPKENNPPKLGVISISGDGVTKQAIGEKTISVFEATDYWISINASDPDGDNLSYTWSVTGGTINYPDNSPPVWTTPQLGDGSYLNVILTVTVDDGRGGIADKSADISVTKRAP